ncbi:MAG: hypothetical protein RR065_00775 [Clostridia bacterium]
MLTVRLLVVCMGRLDAEHAVGMVLRALAMAANPYGIRFAMPASFAPAAAETMAAGVALRSNDVKFYPDGASLGEIGALRTDETHFLLLMGEYGFAEKWDQELFARMRKTPGKGALLTGCIGAQAEEFAPQPYLPAFAEDFADNGVLIEHGLPLVCSTAPVRTLAIDPALVLGSMDFLRLPGLRVDNLSFAAYAAHVEVNALDRAPLWPLERLAERRLARPAPDTLPGTTPARFEQLAGFRYEKKRAGVRTTWGLFTTENAYAQQLPTGLAVAQRARAIVARSRADRVPLSVTAFIDLPAPSKPIPVYILRFGFLRALQNMPLILYTGGAQERFLRVAFPNAWSYPDNAVLPKAFLQKGITAEQHFRRSKLWLLERAARNHPEFTHVLWMNIDLLTHPICAQAMPNFTPLMDDCVHLATVNAVPDLSFVVVPVERVKLLVREAAAITDLDAELKRGFGEQRLWERLVQQMPELFMLHPMPSKHLLFYTMLDQQLLETRYHRLLSNLRPAVRAQDKPMREKV